MRASSVALSSFEVSATINLFCYKVEQRVSLKVPRCPLHLTYERFQSYRCDGTFDRDTDDNHRDEKKQTMYLIGPLAFSQAAESSRLQSISIT